MGVGGIFVFDSLLYYMDILTEVGMAQQATMRRVVAAEGEERRQASEKEETFLICVGIRAGGKR